ncbi:retrovirus-related Pol polyprotein from transposon 17.6 [Trichonephila clavipes]|uniref:Retrovirus-related Pol polyprotein from transposon 17.6 n=1 Tax=Trichonephila clavipes TaxID=2585209 RepID=A0A8X6RZH3_TRICX|nr:retrovirus-related Pol polyprotein from transposon 17.6 [Trichonephila clavipes]
METAVNCMTLFNLNSNLYPTSVIVLKIFGEKIAVCADTSASHTIAAGIVLDIQGGKWHFSGNPRKQYKFFKKTLKDITLRTFKLREDERKNLSPEQARKLNILLDRNEACFQPGGEPTPFIEHHIDMGDHPPPPIATSPYRMNPIKKEVLREQVEELLRQNVIEEKLNSVTKVDAYPLPQMDDLLNKVTPTSFMSTIDLQSGYHQVKVAGVDQDKTALICPFGTYRYLRIPFGL